MRTRISKQWSFDAAHQLPNHDGKCAQPHGHTYTVQIVVAGEPHPVDGRPKEGMVCDFAELDRAWKRIESSLDHRDLNAVLVPDQVSITTSEHLAAMLFEYFVGALEGVVTVEMVRVSETAKTYAEVCG